MNAYWQIWRHAVQSDAAAMPIRRGLSTRGVPTMAQVTRVSELPSTSRRDLISVSSRVTFHLGPLVKKEGKLRS